MKYILSSIIIITVGIQSCRISTPDNAVHNPGSFGIQNTYARLFDIEEENGYIIIRVKNPWQGARDVYYTYYLTDKPWVLPDNINKKSIVKTPVNRVVCMSTTHIAMIDIVGNTNGILGVSGTDYVNDTIVRERIEAGIVKDIGYDNNLNIELIASLKPDIVLVYGIGSEVAGYLSKLVEAGISTMFIGDYLEVHPLAKTEWIKVAGLLYGNLETSERYFEVVSRKYETIKEKVASHTYERPAILLGLPFKDTWYISPGNSYVSMLLDDAGGNYLWKDTDSDVSMPVSLEIVFSKGQEADIWLNIGAAGSLEDIISVDQRFESLPPVVKGNLYNNNLRLNKFGGNDYWESGAMRPDVILKDLVSIIHPELYPAYEPYYYKRIETNKLGSGE